MLSYWIYNKAFNKDLLLNQSLKIKYGILELNIFREILIHNIIDKKLKSIYDNNSFDLPKKLILDENIRKII